MKQLYQYWREKYPPTHTHTVFTRTHTFLISFSRPHTQPKGLSFLYVVSVFNQCLKCISLSSTSPSLPGVHGNWTLTNAYVCNFADGGGAARHAEQGGDEGRGRKNERWDFAERLRTRTFLSSRHSPEKCWGEAKRALAWQMAFSLVTYRSAFLCLVLCVRMWESVQKEPRYKTPTRC